MAGGGNSHQRKMKRKQDQQIAEEAARIAAREVLTEVGPTSSPPLHSQHPLAHYGFRLVGSASLLIGAASIMTGISFWAWVVCLYLGMLILVADPWFEPSLKERHVMRWVVSGLFFLALPVVSFFVIFVSSPLKVDFTGDPGDYPKGQRIGDITWDCPEYCSDFRVTITNATGNDYEHLDLRLYTDRAIVEQTQTSGIPCSFFSADNELQDVRTYDSDGRESLPKTLSAASRVWCTHMPAHSMVQFTFAVAVHTSSGRVGPKRLPDWVEMRATYVVRMVPKYLKRIFSPVPYRTKHPLS